MVETAIKTDAAIRGLDVVLLQLKDRFSRENVELLHEMKGGEGEGVPCSKVLRGIDAPAFSQ